MHSRFPVLIDEIAGYFVICSTPSTPIDCSHGRRKHRGARKRIWRRVLRGTVDSCKRWLGHAGLNTMRYARADLESVRKCGVSGGCSFGFSSVVAGQTGVPPHLPLSSMSLSSRDRGWVEDQSSHDTLSLAQRLSPIDEAPGARSVHSTAG